MAKSRKKDEQPLAKEERVAAIEAEGALESAQDDAGGQLVDESEVEAVVVERETGTNPVVAAEDAAIHTDNETARGASKPKKKNSKEKASADSVKSKERYRSAKYQKALGSIDLEQLLGLRDAIERVQETSYTTFDGTIELHVRLMPKRGKAAESEAFRTLVQLPHGSGKTVNAVILTEELISEIETKKSTKYDVLIAPRSLMPKVAKIAKILGPIGKMPSPKAGTVSDKPEEVLTAIQSGRIEVRADASGNIHQAIGKVSWDVAKIQENAEAVVSATPRTQLRTVTLSATMGPGIRVDIGSL